MCPVAMSKTGIMETVALSGFYPMIALVFGGLRLTFFVFTGCKTANDEKGVM